MLSLRLLQDRGYMRRSAGFQQAAVPSRDCANNPVRDTGKIFFVCYAQVLEVPERTRETARFGVGDEYGKNRAVRLVVQRLAHEPVDFAVLGTVYVPVDQYDEVS